MNVSAMFTPTSSFLFLIEYTLEWKLMIHLLNELKIKMCPIKSEIRNRFMQHHKCIRACKVLEDFTVHELRFSMPMDREQNVSGTIGRSRVCISALGYTISHDRCTDPRFLNINISWMWVIRFIPRLLYPRGKSRKYTLERRLCGPQNWSGRHWKDRIFYSTGTRAPNSLSSKRLKCLNAKTLL
jgi:hypothetical protein